MADHKVEFHWQRGFVEKFTCSPNEKAVDLWFKQGMSLDSIVKILITTSTGEVLHDVEKESPYVASQKEDGSSGRTQKKKSVRKTTRSKTGQ